jgi:transcriptional regulator with XRE-family HTH domain
LDTERSCCGRAQRKGDGQHHPGSGVTLHNGSVARRADLAAFLRARRAAVAPSDVGIAPGLRRRTPGLRREEVALLAGVSVSWYTWLEQGRPINASIDVLDSLARALRLDPVERGHLLELAGHPARQSIELGRDTCPESVLGLLDAVVPAPAYAMGPLWDLLAWNAPFAALFPDIETLPAEDLNLVWLLFANVNARALNGEWDAEARRTLSQFRAEVAPLREDPLVAGLVARLQETSQEFREWWPRYDVAGFESHRRVFDHPVAGRLIFESEQLVPVASPDVRIVVHLPVAGDDSARRLAATIRPSDTTGDHQ